MNVRFAAVVFCTLTAVVACVGGGATVETDGDDADTAVGDTAVGDTAVGDTGLSGAPTSEPTTSASPTSSTRLSTEVPESSTTVPSSVVAADAGSPDDATTSTMSDAVSDTASAQGPDEQVVRIRFESRVGDVTDETLRAEALAILNDDRGWVRAGFVFVEASDAPYRVVLAEGPEVDELCLPLDTGDYASCQNGPVVALNADRWRGAVDHWDGDLAGYRTYLVNHEVGHLIGMRHPTPRCPVPGAPAGVMEQQTGSLRGCVGNGWPREWEIDYAKVRPVVYAPLPDWAPDPVPANGEAG